MRTLKDDSINVRRGVTRAERPRARLALPVLLLVSVALMVLSRLDHSAVRALRVHLGGALAPVLVALATPAEVVRDAGHRIAALTARGDEMERLAARNRELEGWRWKAERLERELAELQRQTATVTGPEPPALTTRVIADAGGMFVRGALIDAGRDNGVRQGHPVVTAEGLVGRVVETGRRTSSVLLVTDANARVPVDVGQSAVRAVMTGDNGAAPHLAFVGQGSIADGDLVTTSGAGGLYPRGLRVGRVSRDGNVWRVVPSAALDDLGYVRVLLYDNDALQLAGERAAPLPREAARDQAAVRPAAPQRAAPGAQQDTGQSTGPSTGQSTGPSTPPDSAPPTARRQQPYGDKRADAAP